MGEERSYKNEFVNVKKVKPEKILLAVPSKMEAGCSEKRKKEEERREIRQKRKRNTRSAKS